MPKDSTEEWVARLKKELNEYEIAGHDLGDVFSPLFEACSKVAKTYNEFKQCVEEGVSTLRSIIKKTH